MELGTLNGNSFTRPLANVLMSYNIDQSVCIWAHHNYNDIEQERAGAGGSSFHRAQRVRKDLIAEGWAGTATWASRTGQPTPSLYLTEGGARVSSSAINYDLNVQAQRLRDAYLRLRNTSDGDGIMGFTQFMYYTQAGPSDSGLLEVKTNPNAADAPRVPAFDYWQNQVPVT